jgi:cation:H+ antiporter
MLLPSIALLAGLLLMLWGADRWVEGASATARHLDMPPLLVGLLVVGFGTSAPEMAVSVLAAASDHPALALGNAWGSNIVNLTLILGLTALVAPVEVRSAVLRQRFPWLVGVTALSTLLVWDGVLSRWDAAALLLAFAALGLWSVRMAPLHRGDALARETAAELQVHAMPRGRAFVWMLMGLAVLLGSARLLVWGAIGVGQWAGASDLLLGLTVLGLGTALPELASCLAAARKGEHDIALGQVVGSCLFNTLAVVGMAGLIAPMDIEPALLRRDLPVMAALSLLLWAMGQGTARRGHIGRATGAVLVAGYLGYAVWVLASFRAG